MYSKPFMFIQIDVNVNKKFHFFRSDFDENEIQYEFRINGGCGFSLRKDMVGLSVNKKKTMHKKWVSYFWWFYIIFFKYWKMFMWLLEVIRFWWIEDIEKMFWYMKYGLRYDKVFWLEKKNFLFYISLIWKFCVRVFHVTSQKLPWFWIKSSPQGCDWTDIDGSVEGYWRAWEISPHLISFECFVIWEEAQVLEP